MTLAIAGMVGTGIALPHMMRLQRSSPVAASALWLVSLTLRALTAIFAALYLAFFLPGTTVFSQLTQWCLHTVLPLVTAHLGLDGHEVGDAATVLPGLLVMVSLLSVSFGVWRAARAVRRLLSRESLGPGPGNSVIVGGHGVMLAAAGLARPRVIVSAGALLELDDEELAAALDHERGHIARQHRFILVFGELCRGIGRWIPGGRRALGELAFHIERDADRWALVRNDRFALASAICKAATTQPGGTVASIPLGGTHSIERLEQLIGEPLLPRGRHAALGLRLIAVTMVAGTLLTAAFIPSSALASAEAFHAHPPAPHCER